VRDREVEGTVAVSVQALKVTKQRPLVLLEREKKVKGK
jgi:hypothetical protein